MVPLTGPVGAHYSLRSTHPSDNTPLSLITNLLPQEPENIKDSDLLKPLASLHLPPFFPRYFFLFFSSSSTTPKPTNIYISQTPVAPSTPNIIFHKCSFLFVLFKSNLVLIRAYMSLVEILMSLFVKDRLNRHNACS